MTFPVLPSQWGQCKAGGQDRSQWTSTRSLLSGTLPVKHKEQQQHESINRPFRDGACLRIQTEDINKRDPGKSHTENVLGWILCAKPMGTFKSRTMPKQWENEEKSLVDTINTAVCVYECQTGTLRASLMYAFRCAYGLPYNLGLGLVMPSARGIYIPKSNKS